MIFECEFKFYTDGDYHIDNFEHLIDEKESHYGAKVKYSADWDNHECPVLYMTAESENWHDCACVVRDLMYDIVRNVRFTHTSIVKSFYDLSEEIIKQLFDEETDYIYETIDGNYEGTEFAISKLEGPADLLKQTGYWVVESVIHPNDTYPILSDVTCYGIFSTMDAASTAVERVLDLYKNGRAPWSFEKVTPTLVRIMSKNLSGYIHATKYHVDDWDYLGNLLGQKLS